MFGVEDRNKGGEEGQGGKYWGCGIGLFFSEEKGFVIFWNINNIAIIY